MYPTICKIGPLTVHSYGLMLAIAVIVCSFLLAREAKTKNIKPDLIYDFVFVVIICGLLGARIFYIFLNLDFFSQNPSDILMIQNGGLAVQGGILGGLLAMITFIKRKNLPMFTVLDLSVVYVALGQAIGRIGCFLNGCCFGKPLSWGVYFPVHGDHLHPTQIYLTVGNLFIFFILRSFLKKSRIEGQTICLYIALSSLLRFSVEFYRADHYQTLLGLSIYQWVAIGFIITAGLFSRKLRSS